jgi:hypothetical protein
MVLLRESGMTQPEIAPPMAVSLSTVNRAHMGYDTGGIKALKPTPIGGGKCQNMMHPEEKALLEQFAKASWAGELSNIHDPVIAGLDVCGVGLSTALFGLVEHNYDRARRRGGFAPPVRRRETKIGSLSLCQSAGEN